MLNILIADDHEVVRRGLKDVLQEGFPKLHVGEAEDFHTVLAFLSKKKWDLIILDIIMPGPNIGEVIAKIRSVEPDLPILILTGIAEHEFAVTTLKAGANGYITKQYASVELINAVKKVLAGEPYLSNEALAGVAASLRQTNDKQTHELLSPRELEIFILIATGKSVKEIAGELGVSDKTIATHIARIKEKTGMMTYVEMTRYALRHKLVE